MFRKIVIFIFLLTVILLPVHTRAHDIGIARVSINANDNNVLMVIAWLPPTAADIAPVPGDFCELMESSQRSAPRGQVRAEWRFRCRRALDATDRLHLAWPVEGVFVAPMSASDVYTGQFIDSEDDAIIVPLTQVLSSQYGSSLTSYVVLGVEHILSGWDHLVFVLMLCLLANGWRLLKLITAFTVGHSITLAGASAGWITAPGPLVEACIALSIVVVAREAIIRRASNESYIIVLAFGLLHGLGFSGALREAGFADSEMLTSLLGFNVGVELGQLLFVGLVLILAWFGRLMTMNIDSRPVLAYAVGSLGVYWMLERTVLFYQ